MMLEEDGKLREKCKSVAMRLSDDKEIVRSLTRKIERIWERRTKLVKYPNTEIDSWREEEFEIDESSETEKNIGGRPKKKLCEDLSSKTRNKILDDFLSQIEGIAEQEGITPDSLLNQLTERSKLRWKVNDDVDSPVVSVDDACALIYNVNFSLSQYQQLRTFFKDHSVNLPTRNEIDACLILL